MTSKDVNVAKTERFEYNKIGSMDIAFDEKKIPIEQIKADGYEIGVNHRPLRRGHINRIKSNFIGIMDSPKVVFDSRDQFYHIVQHQHAFSAFIELMDDGKIEATDTIKCDIIKYKNTMIALDASKPEDCSLCFEYSFRVTDTQRKNCISDTIKMVMELSERYTKETGKKQGIIDYIFDKQYGFKQLSKDTIKQYRTMGEALRRYGLLETAQRELWVQMKLILS